MLRYIDHEKMGRSQLVWLDSHFHFSFAEYYNPKNMNFGELRVVNDDMVEPGTGFDTHPHRDMEIVSYVVDGELTHKDSMGNTSTLGRGQVQYMSAGTGVMHSEHNRGMQMLRFLQIWIMPNKGGYTPNYGDVKFDFDERVDKWLPIARGENNPDNGAPIVLHADANLYATLVPKGQSETFDVAQGRQAYMILIEGDADINGIHLGERDALEITEENVTIQANRDAHILVIEMEKDASNILD